MATNINRVYQKVLAIANKEQRGYITPQEFNLFANQAQMTIFEQYFYDLDQAKRNEMSDEGSFSDIPELIRNKLRPFITTVSPVAGQAFPSNYRTGKIYVGAGPTPLEARKVDHVEASNLFNSTFHRKGLDRNPIYRESGANQKDIEAFDSNGVITNPLLIKVEIAREPNEVFWGYNVVDEQALYNPTHSVDFELHSSEEITLVYKILTLAGITIKNPEIVNVGQGLQNLKTQKEKI